MRRLNRIELNAAGLIVATATVLLGVVILGEWLVIAILQSA